MFASRTKALTVTITSELVCRTGKRPEVPSWCRSSSTPCTPPRWTTGSSSISIGVRPRRGSGFGRLLRRRGRCTRPDGGRQLGRRWRAPVRQDISDWCHDVRGRRTLDVCAPRGRARRGRVRAPRARASVGRRKPARPRIRRVRIRSRQSDRGCRQKRWLRLRRAGDGRRSLLRPPAASDGPAGPDQLEPTAIGRTQRKPGPARPRRL